MPFESKEDLIKFLQEDELIGLDSEHSIIYKDLIEKFSAKGVDFNRWWVFTPTDWVCPSCSRKKAEILRLNKHGYLTGHLHEHHDHMGDCLHKEFTKVSESKDIVVADLMSQRFVARTAFSLSAYDNTVICSDCNIADAKAKKIVNCPKEFSFSPSEIKKFVIPINNQENEVNVDVAMQIWNECKSTFYLRMKLVKYFAELAASNSHWYQPSPKTARQLRSHAEHLMRYYGLNEINRSEPESLLYESNKFSGAKDSWRKNKSFKYCSPPTASELQHLINLDTGYWKRVPDSWSCPICKRNKFQCVRKSNKGRWTFKLSTAKKFYNTADENYVQNLLVCNDCNITSTHIVTEIKNAINDESISFSAIIFPHELSNAIEPIPNSKHGVKNEIIDQIILSAISRIRSGEFCAMNA